MDMFAYSKNMSVISGVLFASVLAILMTSQSAAAQTLVTGDSITLRKTATSVPGIPSPGHEDHQIVMALPPKGDDKIWVGTVSWISSEPIEVGFLIAHNQSAEDEEHSKVETLTINNTSNTILASTNLTGSTPELTFGTTDFAVDQLVFHSTNNTKFTVTFALDAVAKDITNS
ncbi:conserved exported protein of unknown function [Candidatus Nitrosocosmicus franklandus]|uniref:Uncharacterized protein n=2 Tax=Candidatus Nitrosocosmicus franklandianus TaxID=1798806 RepID=A0A484I747_9ARCH|nr:conserved exported protein of unknown function [Candidatus Nitrosocosmicus franklandus]